MHILSPLGIAQSARALIGRPVRHRRRRVLRRRYRTPQGAWWANDDRWFPLDTPPRHGNRLTSLIDGEEAMGAMYDAIAAATTSVYLSAWFLTPQFRLRRPPDDTYEPRNGKGGEHAFLPLLARKADEVDVRILLWPGAILGKFQQRRVRITQQTIRHANPKISVCLDRHERLSHCQHQKSLVVDGRLAFVGGLDPTAFDADRWDVPEHLFRAGRNWHDVHWSLEGPCVADVAANFVQRWNAVAPALQLVAPAPPPPVPDGVAAQVQRTIPKGVYSFARRGIFGIAHAYRQAIARAERYIYLENQYLWSPEITDALCEALQRGTRSDLRIAVVLPAHPNVGKGDTDRHIRQLLKADAGRGVVRAYTLYTSCWNERKRRYEYRPIYVHAKVAVIDDAWATVGSANLNGRGMVSDSELNISTTGAEIARTLRLRLWSEHLACDLDSLRDLDPADLLDRRWPTLAAQQQDTVIRRAGLLTAAVYPYPLGRTIADFGRGEIESALLDR